MFKRLLGNFWTAFEINLQNDKKEFPNLKPEQQDTFLKINSLLADLDSVQTDYVDRFRDKITDSSIVALMVIVAQQEVVHNHSYSLNLSTVATKKQEDEVFEFWKKDEILRRRNDYLVNGYAEFIGENTVASMLSSIIHDVVLEGIDFYSAFAFFYDLARQGVMVGTSTMMNYINRDEQQHVNLFCHIFREILAENPEFATPELNEYITAVLKRGAELEIEWSRYVIGNKFATISVDELEGYIKFVANLRAKMLGGANLPFPKQETNPMDWIKFYEDVDLGRTDFFEQKVRQYTKTGENFNDTESLDLDDLDLDI
jgi:ribonucleoside-diphosphate reductase beta chain